MMRQVGVLEAKTHLSALLDSIEQTGEEILITRHGKPVVRMCIASEKPATRANGRALAERLKQFRQSQLAMPEIDVLTWNDLKTMARE
jgi:prevent-host-death family protein